MLHPLTAALQMLPAPLHTSSLILHAIAAVLTALAALLKPLAGSLVALLLQPVPAPLHPLALTVQSLTSILAALAMRFNAISASLQALAAMLARLAGRPVRPESWPLPNVLPERLPVVATLGAVLAQVLPVLAQLVVVAALEILADLLLVLSDLALILAQLSTIPADLAAASAHSFSRPRMVRRPLRPLLRGGVPQALRGLMPPFARFGMIRRMRMLLEAPVAARLLHDRVGLRGGRIRGIGRCVLRARESRAEHAEADREYRPDRRLIRVSHLPPPPVLQPPHACIACRFMRRPRSEKVYAPVACERTPHTVC